MPQSHAHILIHIIFSTQHRVPMLADAHERAQTFEFIGGVANKNGCAPIIVGGVADHVHALVNLGRTNTVADLVKEMKRASSIWAKESLGAASSVFAWQNGYGAFSVSPSKAPDVAAYIANQEEHHRAITFQGEYRKFLTKHGIEFDERYVWD